MLLSFPLNLLSSETGLLRQEGREARPHCKIKTSTEVDSGPTPLGPIALAGLRARNVSASLEPKALLVCPFSRGNAANSAARPRPRPLIPDLGPLGLLAAEAPADSDIGLTPIPNVGSIVSWVPAEERPLQSSRRRIGISLTLLSLVTASEASFMPPMRG